jgi:hypothetical protein
MREYASSMLWFLAKNHFGIQKYLELSKMAILGAHAPPL